MVKINTSSEPRIVKYQDKDEVFLFADFWQGRDYDHIAEEIILDKYLKKYFSNKKDNSWLVDIGGSFGRLLPNYSPYFKEIALLDYAASEFHVAKKIAKKEGIKLHLVAANAYHLPLANDSQPALIAVRLIHHLEEALWFFEEVERVLKPGGIFICQAANKNHLKALLQAIMKFDFSIWRLNWLDIGEKGVQDDGSFSLIRNYSPTYLESMIEEVNLKIVRKRSTSWLRNIKFLQKIPASIYILEKPLQWLSFIFPLGPSNWYVIKKTSSSPSRVGKHLNSGFLFTLCSPRLKKHLPQKIHPRYLKKSKGKTTYLDLRYPKN